jgi:hypothetical protein
MFEGQRELTQPECSGKTSEEGSCKLSPEGGVEIE